MKNENNLKNYPAMCKVNLNKSWEKHYWTIKWGITNDQLMEAVKNSESECVSKVEAYLLQMDLIT